MDANQIAGIFQGDLITIILKLVLGLGLLGVAIWFYFKKNKMAAEETKRQQTKDQAGTPGAAQEIANQADPAADEIDAIHRRKP